MEAIGFSLSLLFWSIHTWETMWKVNFYFCVYFGVFSFTVYSTSTGLPPWTVFGGETHTDLFLYVTSIVFYLSITWWRFSAEVTVDFCRKIWKDTPPYPIPSLPSLSEKSNSWEPELGKFKLKVVQIFLTGSTGDHWNNWHSYCIFFLKV